MLALIVGTTLMLATLLPRPVVAAPLFGEATAELFRLLAPAFVIAAVGIVPLAMLERQLDFRRISMIEIAGSRRLSGLGRTRVGRPERPGVRARRAGRDGGLGGLLVAARSRRLPRWRPRQLREIAGFGLPAGAASMAMVGYGNIDYLILGAKLSPAQVGFYYRAYSLGVQYETKISNIVSRIAFPIYSRTEDLEHMRAPALAGHPDQRGRDLPAAGAVHRHRPAAGALGLRPTVGPGRGASPDPHGRRDGADDQQRDALAGARGR